MADIRKLKDKAAELVSKGKFEKAASVYREVVEADPKDVATRQKLAEALRRAGEVGEAIEEYKQVADRFARDGLLIKAIAICKTILELDPEHGETQQALADLYSRRQATDAARPPVRQTLMMAAAVRPAAAPAAPSTPPEERSVSLKLPTPPAPAAAAPPPPPLPQPPARATGSFKALVPPPPPPPAPEPEPVPLDITEFALPEPEAITLGGNELPQGAVHTGMELILDAAEHAIEDGVVEELVLDEVVEPLPLPMAEPAVAAAAEAEPEIGIEVEPEPEVAVGEPEVGIEIEPEPEPEPIPAPAPRPAPRAAPPPAPRAAPPPPAPPPRSAPPPPAKPAVPIFRPPTPAAAPPAAAARAAPPPPPPPPAPAGPGTGLPQIPIFSDLGREAFVALMDGMVLHRIAEGDAVLREGETGTSFFVIASGSFAVSKRDDRGESILLAHLGEGDFFGEMALLSGSPRAATVLAETDSEVLEFRPEILVAIARQHPQLAQSIRRFYRQRLLANAMATSPVFRPFTAADRKIIMSRFVARETKAGDVIVKEGDPSDGLYVILEGAVDVLKHQAGKDVLVSQLREGDLFGEMSCLRKIPATASVVVRRPGTLLKLPRKTFDELVVAFPQILELVSDLSSERTENLDAILSGHAEWTDEGLVLT